MINIIISIFDEAFMFHAMRMYKSYRFFDKETKMYAGSINLSQKSIEKLESIGVEVLFNKKKEVPKHLQLCDLIIEDYIEDVEWDSLMWIDADTIVLRPLNHLFSQDFDFICHGGNINLGYFKQGAFNCYPYKSTWIKREIKNNELVETCKWGDFFAMGLWVAKNKELIKDFNLLYKKNKRSYFEGDICSELLNAKYKCKQLDGFEWSVGTLQNDLLYYENDKVILKVGDKKHFPYQFGYSRIGEERPECEAIEKFYKKRILKLG